VEEAQELYQHRGKEKARAGKEQMTSVIWTTPMGLPIVQPYRKLKRKQVMTGLQSVYISDPNAPSEGVFSLYSICVQVLIPLPVFSQSCQAVFGVPSQLYS